MMSKKDKKEFAVDEFDRSTLAQYFLGKRDGMFEAFELIDDSITELKRSLDNVWMIYDEADSLDGSSQDQKDRISFAMHTLFVLRNIFDDKYYEEIEKAKRDVEEFEDEI
jgi:hypothetical protein